MAWATNRSKPSTSASCTAPFLATAAVTPHSQHAPRTGSCPFSGCAPRAPPLAARGAYDHVVQGLPGMAMLAGQECDPPIKVGFPVIDAATGLVGALAMMAA